MSPDPNLPFITLSAAVLFGAAALFADPLLMKLGRLRGLKPPPRSIVMIFRIWFAVLAGGSLWLLLASHHGLLSRLGAR